MVEPKTCRSPSSVTMSNLVAEDQMVGLWHMVPPHGFMESSL